MPTLFSHVAVPLALGVGLGRRAIPPRLLFAGVAASVLPDLDVLAFRLDIPYEAAFGHRGALHSLVFCVALGALAAAAAPWLKSPRPRAAVFVFFCALSHALLDMLTNAGLGVALFWPLSDARLFLPWRPIEAAPLSLARLSSTAGLGVWYSEVRFVWLPALVLTAVLIVNRRPGHR